jgi:hypothetical protein
MDASDVRKHVAVVAWSPERRGNGPAALGTLDRQGAQPNSAGGLSG